MKGQQAAGLTPILYTLVVILTLCFAHPAFDSPSASLTQIKCDKNTKRPSVPTRDDCDHFLEQLYEEAMHEGGQGFHYYGRDVEPCALCVKIPVIVQYPDTYCAALISIDRENDKELSIFSMFEMWQVLKDLMDYCWLLQNQDGKGYPAYQFAWVALVEPTDPDYSISGNQTATLGNSTVSVLTLGQNQIANSTLQSGFVPPSIGTQ